jgi:hypothetical protein
VGSLIDIDHTVIENALARCKNDPKGIPIYFLGIIQFVFDPTAHALPVPPLR